MVINFNDKGNAGIRYQTWEEGGKNKWSAWIDSGRSLDERLNQKQKKELSEIRVGGDEHLSPELAVDAICSLVEETRSKEHQKLGIEISRIMADDGLKELLLAQMDERFGMKPMIEGNQTPAENKA